MFPPVGSTNVPGMMRSQWKLLEMATCPLKTNVYWRSSTRYEMTEMNRWKKAKIRTTILPFIINALLLHRQVLISQSNNETVCVRAGSMLTVCSQGHVFLHLSIIVECLPLNVSKLRKMNTEGVGGVLFANPFTKYILTSLGIPQTYLPYVSTLTKKWRKMQKTEPGASINETQCANIPTQHI